ncbi:hypothetical protein [Thiolapillus sp.]
MKISKPNRVTRTYTQQLVAEPSEVFPLLCPVREAEWIEGWDPEVVISRSGVAEQGCVFVTKDGAENAVWYITRHEPENGCIEMVKFVAGVTVCQLSIRLRAVASGSEADVTYTHTSLGPEGDAYVNSFTEAYYRQFMQDWETRLNNYLLHSHSS